MSIVSGAMMFGRNWRARIGPMWVEGEPRIDKPRGCNSCATAVEQGCDGSERPTAGGMRLRGELTAGSSK